MKNLIDDIEKFGYCSEEESAKINKALESLTEDDLKIAETHSILKVEDKSL